MVQLIMALLAVALSVSEVASFTPKTVRHRRAYQRNQMMSIDAGDFANHASAVVEGFSHLQHQLTAMQVSNDVLGGNSDSIQSSFMLAEETVAAYNKVDKTGFIGFFATYVEIAIDLGRELLQKLGVQNAYGYSIILFTILVKAVTLPLTTTQLESTTKMQKLTPLQKKIQEKYADDEQTKNQLLSQLFQAAQVNPLAGCFPALVQIPVFISLYRALTNLVAENKLDEPFLWIPDLEGPVYAKPPAEALDWFKSIFTGNPILGWHDTLAFLSLPVLLYVGQTISQKVLAPPKDPNRVKTEQEIFSEGLVNNLPLVVAFFSINVPAGLGLYWVANNLLTTVITVIVKAGFKDDGFPPEVTQMMALVDGPASGVKAAMAASQSEMDRKATVIDDRPKVAGFGSGQSPWAGDAGSAGNIIDTEAVVLEDAAAAGEAAAASAVGGVDEAAEAAIAGTVSSGTAGTDAAVAPSKRKKRVKPAKSNKRNKKK